MEYAGNFDSAGLQAVLDRLDGRGGALTLPAVDYCMDTTLTLRERCTRLSGEAWNYSADPNGVFEGFGGTKLRLSGQGHAALLVGQTHDIGGVMISDLGVQGDIAGMDTRPLMRSDTPMASAGLCFSAVRTDQCEFTKLSFCGLSSGICATGNAELDACSFDRLNLDGCGIGVYFAPRAAYYDRFRNMVVADNPYYGFYADGEGKKIHNLQIFDSIFVRNAGAFGEGEDAAAVYLNAVNSAHIDRCLFDFPGTFWYYPDTARENDARQISRRPVTALWVKGDNNRITNNTFTHSSAASVHIEGKGNLLLSNIADRDVIIEGEGNQVCGLLFTKPDAHLILRGAAAHFTVLQSVDESRVVRE